MPDLLDTRGYVVEIDTNSKRPVKVHYLGSSIRSDLPQTYEEDPYVVSRVEKDKFTTKYQAALKDEMIRKSGLKLIVEAEEDTQIEVHICGEKKGILSLEEKKKTEIIFDVSDLCKEEREYLENTHRVLYLLMEEVDRICRKHHIRYFLVFGGLLGALRYGDIIPWDDDIDIAMTREEFERFQKIAPKELKKDFMYLDYGDLGGAFLDFMCRIMYMKEEVPGNVFRKIEGKGRKDVNNHLPLDIFILDKASDHKQFHKFQMLMLRGIYGLAMGHRAYIKKNEYQNRSKMTRFSVFFLSAIGRWIPLKGIFWLHEKASTMNQKKDTKDYFMSNGFLPFIHTRYRREWFDSNHTMMLGNLRVCTPKDEKAYLKRAYYDYYHYPPMEKRVPGHSPKADGVF